MTKLLFLLLLIVPTILFGDDFYNRGDQLLRDNKLQAAERLSLERLKVDNESLDAYFFLAAIKLKEGKIEEAQPFIDKFKQYHRLYEKKLAAKNNAVNYYMDAHYSGFYMYLGRTQFIAGDFNESLEWLIRAKPYYFKDPMFNFFIGISYKQTGDYDNAIKHLKRQLSLNPKEPSPLYNIACVNSVFGKKKEAILWLRKAIKAHPKYRSEAQKDADFKNIKHMKEFQELTDI